MARAETSDDMYDLAAANYPSAADLLLPEPGKRVYQMMRLGKRSLDKRVYQMMRLGKRLNEKRVYQMMRLGKRYL